MKLFSNIRVNTIFDGFVNSLTFFFNFFALSGKTGKCKKFFPSKQIYYKLIYNTLNIILNKYKFYKKIS
ncbi:MAG: hypothetical protein A2Y41_11750 [Spirochaetes bacterium GWB1_36_13]|nr:MAG: hypothetical protein A2Y41_11750 [Spirochaetes bacterium GWB1_36_13]